VPAKVKKYRLNSAAKFSYRNNSVGETKNINKKKIHGIDRGGTENLTT
jgi:hypothetical protein